MNLKKIALAICAITMLSSAKAQVDEVKLNAIGALFNNYSVGYERGLSETSSVGLWVNYQSYNFGIGDEDNKISGIGFVPEFRFYFSPDDECDGFFVGPYLKYASLSTKSDYTILDDDGDYQDYNDVKVSSNRFVIGLNLGRKWVTDGGFLFETSFGFGKALASGVNYDNDNVQTYYDDNDILELEINFDLRLGINVGYRF
jgi:hypothetical protein